jgi:hypothetical protein
MPIHRLDEEPTRRGTLQDVTCDSDGKIDQLHRVADDPASLELHTFRHGEPYILGIFLTGAYQEILGDLHNLFGDTNAVHLFLTEDGGYEVGGSSTATRSPRCWSTCSSIRRSSWPPSAGRCATPRGSPGPMRTPSLRTTSPGWRGTPTWRGMCGRGPGRGAPPLCVVTVQAGTGTRTSTWTASGGWWPGRPARPGRAPSLHLLDGPAPARGASTPGWRCGPGGVGAHRGSTSSGSSTAR